MSGHNTVFLRLEGPLQSWGVTSRFVIRDTADVPSKSGVLGLVCAAMGLRRGAANARLKELAALRMGVRIDRPGTKLTDYHTAGAGIGMMSAEGKIKITATTREYETHVMRKEYLADAAFLVALRGDTETVGKVVAALDNPVWPPFLGRKSCPPSVPVFAGIADCNDLEPALKSDSVPWRPRLEGFEDRPTVFRAVIESAPPDGRPVQDVPVSFTHRVYGLRWVKDVPLEGVPVREAEFTECPRPARHYVDYKSAVWRAQAEEQRAVDHGLCVFCKSRATQVHHVTYAPPQILRSVCTICHDAMTLLEYAAGMGNVRIDPCDPANRDLILAQRTNILNHHDRLRRNRALRTDDEED